MAGLWEHWTSQQQSLYSCTIITQPSGGKLADLHSRMPVMLELDQAEQWLNDGVAVFDLLLQEQNTEGLIFYPVDKAVNKSTNEGETLIHKVDSVA